MAKRLLGGVLAAVIAAAATGIMAAGPAPEAVRPDGAVIDARAESVTPKGTLPPKERAALIALYNNCNGPHWSHRTNWRNANDTDFNAPGTEGTWHGVYTGDLNTTVFYISLTGNNLFGSIPPEVGNLTNLDSLSLSYNQLTSLPPEIGNLTNLAFLNLYLNQFTALPPEFGNLTNLDWLDLSYNQLTALPPEFGNLTDLRHLHISENRLTTLPPEIGNLSALQSLDLLFNQISMLPPEIGNLTNLCDLNLHSNQLTALPPEIGNLATLDQLVLSANRLAVLPPEIGDLTYLDTLYLSSNQLAALPPEIGNLANLRALYLSSNQLTALPPEMGNLTKLMVLRLPSNQIKGEIPSIFNQLVSLMDGNLDLRWNALFTNDAALQALIDRKQDGNDWVSTQTVAPVGVTVSAEESSSLEVSWTPIPYVGDQGGYRVLYSSLPGGPYSLYGTTQSKSISSMTVNGLQCEAPYFFRVETATNPHENNLNTVTSEPSQEISGSATTTIPPIAGPSPACMKAFLSTEVYRSFQWNLDGNTIPGATAQTYNATSPGSYTVRVTDFQGCSGTSAAFVVHANPEPTITGLPAGCGAVTLSTGQFSSYQWSQDGDPVPGAMGQTFSAIFSGSYSVEVTDSFGCRGLSGGFPVTINSTPAPAISGPSSGCSPARLSTGSFTAYQWLLDGSPISGATGQHYDAMSSGSYTVKVTGSNGCTGISPAKVVSVFDSPAPSISGPHSGCGSVQLSTSIFASCQWWLDGSPIPGASGQTLSAVSSGAYGVEVTDSNGCRGVSGNFAVTINSSPTPAISGPSSGCGMVQLSTALFSSYQWSLDGSQIPGATGRTYSATSSGGYSVYVIDANGCAGESAAFAVVVTPLPAPAITGPDQGCASWGVVLSTQLFHAYQWKLNGVPISGATGQSHTATASGSYTVFVTGGQGCAATSTEFPVTIYPGPAPSISGPPSGCGKVPLSTGAFSSYQWSLDSTPIPGATAQEYEANIGGAYAVTVTSAEGCTGVSAVKAVAVYPVPEPLVSGPSSGCGTVLLSTANFSSYRWLLGGAPIPGASGQSYAAGSSGSYSVEVTDSHGCSAVSPSVAVEVYRPPVPAISGPAEGCAPRGVVLGTQPYVRYQWSLDGAELSGATDQSYTANASGSYSVSVVDSNGCGGGSTAFPLKVNPAPNPTISGPSPACGTATLSTQPFSAFQWYLDGAAIPGATGQSHTASVPGAYTVGVVDANGCDALSPVFLVSPLPTPSVSGPSSGCSPVQLSTSAFSSYQWLRGGDPIPGATDQGYAAKVSGEYAVTVTDSSGCQGTSPAFSVTVSICLHGDCDGDGAVSIGELQRAVNMFLGSIPPDCGVDCNGDGQVSIGELQKVINAFLGLPANC